ncbi:g1317 [Coccomyxa viridis]|uniref:G1317 protein n=1 Tax=Coccomyxa viridis TaxID=1274662 RepID=A0ABP1FLI5_9CHLO
MLPMRKRLMRLLTADESYDDDGPYDPAEHSPMYDVDMEDRTAVFDLAMEDDSDDGGGLLDWSILAGKQKRKFCGCDWSWLPCCNCAPPGWWLSLSRRQRLALQGCFAACFVLVLFVVIIAVVFIVYR